MTTSVPPDWKAQGLLDGGIASLNNIEAGLTAKFLSPANEPDGNHLTKIEMLVMPFRFNVVGAATALTRDEFIAECKPHMPNSCASPYWLTPQRSSYDAKAQARGKHTLIQSMQVAQLRSAVQTLPAMRQQFGDQMVFVRGQTLQHIFEISVRVMPIELGALNQAHDRSRTLAGSQGTCE